MNRRACWRAHPDDPKAALGWFIEDADARPLSLSAFFGLALALVGLAASWTPWVFLLLPLLALLVRVPRRFPDLSPLQTTPPPGPAFACQIGTYIGSDRTQCVAGVLTGLDDGIVTFVEGWLHYAGRCTEFALRSTDIRGTALVGIRRTTWLDDSTSLAIEPLDDRDADFLNRSFRIWEREETTPVPAGTSILPPLTVHRSGLCRAWRDVLMVVAAATAVLGILMAFGQTGFFVVFFGGGGLPVFQRLVKLRRLARQERAAWALRQNETPSAPGPS